ncbi:MAG: MBL fold metallo-hydrolase [Desulfobacterales bacterium]|nr:MBL fold metallo-hydrolase [Desulfobacterales bacterium]
MIEIKSYNRPIQIAEGIYWVGFRDEKTNIGCNPYLVIEGDQAVLIDGGSRSDFADVMMKILQVGLDPRQINSLIYQHYDPDLCGSMMSFIDMCENPNLKIISDKNNNIFISYYISRDKFYLLKSISDYKYKLILNDRVLEFIPTPYSHSAGSFVTYDTKTGTLFSSDLFGSIFTEPDMFLSLDEKCYSCTNYDSCPNQKPDCPLKGIFLFHTTIMPCTKSLRYAMHKIEDMDIKCIAPQHGSILTNRREISYIIKKLKELEQVGIDGIE